MLPDYVYVNLENPGTRQLAAEDPRAFLKQYPTKPIFDEIQPALESFHQKVHPLAQRSVVYSGEPIEFSDGSTAKNYKEVASLFN